MLLRLFKFLTGGTRKTGLALLQHKMQKLLWSGLAPSDIRLVLLNDADLAPFHDYIAQMEDDMLAVGSDLARKWGAL